MDERAIRQAIDELRNAPAMQRAKLAHKAGLPAACLPLGTRANPLLAFLLDDEALASAHGEQTARVWLQVDGPACIAHVMARGETIAARVLVLVLADARVDKTEAYEVIAPRFRADSELRDLLTRGYFPGAPSMRSTLSDPRIVDLALEIFDVDIAAACRLLGVHGSERAIDELRDVLDRASSLDAAAIAAFEGLELAYTQQQMLDMLAAMLTTSPMMSSLSPREIALGPLGFRIGVVHGYAFQEHAAVRANARLQEIIEACAQEYPVVPPG